MTTDTSAVPLAVINTLAQAVGASFNNGKSALIHALEVNPNENATNSWPRPDVELFKIVGGKDKTGKEAWGLVGAYASVESPK
jgi:hypothetical protein